MTNRMGGTRRFNWKLAVVLVLGVVVLAGMVYWLRQWRRQTTAAQSLETGRKAYEAKEWKKAAVEIGRYVAVHQDAVEELLMYADAQLHVMPQKENNVGQARQAYHQVLRYEPGNTKAADRLSQLYLQIGLPNDAAVIIERRLKAADDPDARQIYGLALAASGKYAQAAQEFIKVIEAAPDKVAAYQRLAELARLRTEEVPMSPLEILKKAVSRNPDSAGARMALGGYLARYGESQEARAQGKAELEAAKKLELREPNTRINLASRLMEVGDFAGAREQLDAVGRDNPGLVALWMAWAVLVKTNGTPQEADAVAKEALARLGPEAYVFLPVAIDLFVYAKDEAEAKKALDMMREADTRHPDMPYLEGLVAQSQGNVREAIKIWQAAVGQEKSFPRLRLALAEAYDRIGDTVAAIRELRILASQFPEAAAVRLSLARALGRLGAWREAATHAQAAAKLEPQNIEAQAVALSARAHMAVLDRSDRSAWGAIENEVEALKKAAPGNAVVALLAADVAQMQGDLRASRDIAASLAGNETTRLQGLLLEVETLWRAGKAEEAVAKGRETVRQYPDAVAAIEQLSDLLARTGDTAGSIAVVQEGIRNTRAQGQKELQNVLVRLYVRSGDSLKARELLEATIDADKQDITSRVLLIGMTEIKEKARIQRMVDEIRKIEGQEGFRWKYQQARLWLFSDDWRSRLTETVDLLRSNLKADPRDIDSQLLLGAAEEKAGRASLAIDAYRKAYQQAPDSAQVVFYLVGALQRNNNLDEAGQILDRAAERGIAEPRLAGLRLGQQLRQGQTALAIETVSEIMQRQPENLLLKVFMANLKMRQNDLPGAHAILDGLDQEDPNVATAKVDLLMREGRKDEALGLANRMVDKLDSAGAYLFRARILTATGALDAAEADYQKITRLEPDKIQSWLLLSDFLAARNKLADAMKAVERGLDLNATNPMVVTRAVRLYTVRGDAKSRRAADELMDAALKANPDDADLVVFQAQRLISRGTTESVAAARKALDDLARKRPEMSQVWRLSAQVALLEGDSERAVDAISRGLAAEPDDGQRRALLMLKAEAERAKYPVLAATTLRGVWDRDHTDTAVGLALASAYIDSGEGRKALPIIGEMRGSAKGKDAMLLDLVTADALFTMGETQQAVEKARSVAAEAGDDPRPTLTLVRLLAKADKVDEALGVIRNWQQAHAGDKATILMAGQALVAAGTLPARPNAAAEQKSQRIQDAAIRVFESAVAAYPEENGFKLLLAMALQARGYNAEAEQHYRELLSKRPSDVAFNNLAWMLAEDKARLKEALDLADQGREKFPDFAAIVDTRGVIYERMGRLADAEKELREAVRVSRVSSGELASAKLHLAGVLAARGKNDEAMRYANEALGGGSGAQLSPQDRLKAEELVAKLTSGAAGAKKP